MEEQKLTAEDVKKIARDHYETLRVKMLERIAETGLTEEEWTRMIVMSGLLSHTQSRNVFLLHQQEIEGLRDSLVSQLEALTSLAGQVKDLKEALAALAKGDA